MSDRIFFFSFLIVTLTVYPAGNVLPEAADEVDACAFVFLPVWRVEMCGTAAAGVTEFSIIVLSTSSFEILVDDYIM